jgi:hypothetical protein
MADGGTAAAEHQRSVALLTHLSTELNRQLEIQRDGNAALRARVVVLEAGARNATRLLQETKDQLERERCGHLRFVGATEAQSKRQQVMITKRSEEIASLLASGVGNGGVGGGGDEAVQALLLVIAELREDAEKEEKRRPNMCCICFEQPPNAVLMPCRHGGSCMDCASKITGSAGRCPLCRTPIDECMQVFA